MPEDNGKQNRNESCTNKYQKHTQKDNDDFENSTKCCICIKGYIDSDVIVISLKNIQVLHIEIVMLSSNVKLNQKISVVFQNLKNSHLIIQEQGKFNLKINVIPNTLETYISFSIE